MVSAAAVSPLTVPLASLASAAACPATPVDSSARAEISRTASTSWSVVALSSSAPRRIASTASSSRLATALTVTSS